MPRPGPTAGWRGSGAAAAGARRLAAVTGRPHGRTRTPLRWSALDGRLGPAATRCLWSLLGRGGRLDWRKGRWGVVGGEEGEQAPWPPTQQTGPQPDAGTAPQEVAVDNRPPLPPPPTSSWFWRESGRHWVVGLSQRPPGVVITQGSVAPPGRVYRYQT